MMGKIQDGRQQPYLLMDLNQIQTGTNRPHGEHPRQKNLKSGLAGYAITRLLQC